MDFSIVLLFVGAVLICYTWLGYPCLVWFLSRLFPRTFGIPESPSPSASVSVILPVHNEAKCLAAKLQNCLGLRYPHELLEILVVSDHSTDNTESIVEEFSTRDSRIRLIRNNGRAGKSHAQNLAVEQAVGDILFFTDANAQARSDVLMLLVSNFADPEVGLVTSTLYFSDRTNAISEGQGLYWRYELFLRKTESDLGILATGSGAALAMRSSLFRPMEGTYGDDCVLPLDVRLQGYRVLHDSRPVVFDSMPHSIEGELRARIRMTTRNWTGTLSRPALLNALRFPLTSWALFSHKLLRWLTPFFLLMILLANSFLALHGRFVVLWFAQVLFYLAAIVGWLRARKRKHPGIFSHPFSFCLANLGFFLGLIQAFRARRIEAY